MPWQFLLNPKFLGVAGLTIAVILSVGFIFKTGKEVGTLRGEKSALSLELKQMKEQRKECVADLKIARKDLKDAQSELDRLSNDYETAVVINDTLIARYCAFYKKITGKELKARDLRITRRGK